MQVYKANRYSTTELPEATEVWEAHDALAQTYSGLNQPDKEINHYRKAIKILTASTKVPPEVDFQPYISKTGFCGNCIC